MSQLNELKKVEPYADQCMRCGFCSFFCPVYQEEHVESSVARGKNYLVKLVLQGQQEFTPHLGEIIGKCLLCKRCAANCPAKAQIDRVVVAARAQMVQEKGLGLLKRIIFRRLMARRRTLARAAKLLQVAQRFLPGTRGQARHLPDFVKSMGRRSFPELAKTFLRDRVEPVYRPAEGAAKMRVGFFMGCATDFVFPDLGLKVIELLRRQGLEVVVPRDQNCCGAAILFSGDFQTARALADSNARAFENVDYVVTACGTCSSSLKDYRKYLPDTSEREATYGHLEGKVKDATEFLTDVLKVQPRDLRLREEYRGKKVTWHDPCHLVRYQNIREQPRTLLRSLDGLEYAEMPNADLCCGMGGSFSVYHYDLTKKIAARKLEGIRATGADIVATACPGCMMNLFDQVLQSGMPQQVRHLLELVEPNP